MHIHQSQYYIIVAIKYNLFSILTHILNPKLKTIQPLSTTTNTTHNTQPAKTQITKTTQIKIKIQDSRSDHLEPLDCNPTKTTKLHHNTTTRTHHNATPHQTKSQRHWKWQIHTTPPKTTDLTATTSHNLPLPRGEKVKWRERRDGDERELDEKREEGRRKADWKIE